MAVAEALCLFPTNTFSPQSPLLHCSAQVIKDTNMNNNTSDDDAAAEPLDLTMRQADESIQYLRDTDILGEPETVTVAPASPPPSATSVHRLMPALVSRSSSPPARPAPLDHFLSPLTDSRDPEIRLPARLRQKGRDQSRRELLEPLDTTADLDGDHLVMKAPHPMPMSLNFARFDQHYSNYRRPSPPSPRSSRPPAFPIRHHRDQVNPYLRPQSPDSQHQPSQSNFFSQVRKYNGPPSDYPYAQSHRGPLGHEFLDRARGTLKRMRGLGHHDDYSYGGVSPPRGGPNPHLLDSSDDIQVLGYRHNELFGLGRGSSLRFDRQHHHHHHQPPCFSPRGEEDEAMAEVRGGDSGGLGSLADSGLALEEARSYRDRSPLSISGRTKRGRPRKHAPKIPLPPLYVFIRNLLHNKAYNPKIVSWVHEPSGKFKVNNTAEFARTWGRMKSNRSEEMNYEKMSRAMRYHYGSKKNNRKGHLAMVKEKRLVYKFGELAVRWRSHEVEHVACDIHDLCLSSLCLWTKE